MRNITVIPASVHRFTDAPLTQVKKRKVAAYARVSTDEEEQQSSYAAQCDYYENYIKSRSDWEFVAIYADEGVTGTSTKKRVGFTKMVNDALAGKIDLIVTKSVSRFARNTIDSLTTIRKLKEHGIEIFFEKENILTFDPKCELLLTILSSLSQEEARSISENTTWGQRKRFADGKVNVPFSRFLGYDRGEDGNLVVNHEQAQIVKLIFKLFLLGMSYLNIARELTGRGIKSPAGNDKWIPSTIKGILSNEKMKGDALLQKRFTADFLTKKVVKNEGQIPQYYVTGNHEPIIDPLTFDLVQDEMKRRSRFGKRYSGATIFACRVKCGECGGWYGSKVWHSNDKYRRVIYRCNNKYNKTKCSTPHLTEEQIKDIFVNAFNRLFDEKETLLENLKLLKDTICDTKELEIEKQKFLDEMKVLSEMVQKAVASNARIAQNQEEYQKRYDELITRYNAAKAKHEEIAATIEERRLKAGKLGAFEKNVQSCDSPLTKFDEILWGTLVEYITVYGKDDVGVTFKDGTEIRI